MPASRSSLPPLGEAEWRGGVGVGGGWARREGDEAAAAVGPGQPSPAPDRRQSTSGSAPHPLTNKAPREPPPPPLGLCRSRPSTQLGFRRAGGGRCAPPTFNASMP